MKHNDWFENTFLASLKSGQWITEKQVAICKRYKEDTKHTEWRVKEILSGFWAGYNKAPVKDEATA